LKAGGYPGLSIEGYNGLVEVVTEEEELNDDGRGGGGGGGACIKG
jgi:hypothetical protein